MRSENYSSINPQTGDVTWEGPLSIEKGDHSNMPSRSEAYLPGDERGHVNASSLGGNNTKANIVPQNADLNHGAYYSMEQGERAALQNGATIVSSKTAFVNGQPGDRPSAFIVNDNVTYANGRTESVHHSFTNVSNAEQQAWNDQSAAFLDEIGDPNPSDGLRSSMTTEEYADLMETTDAELPGIADAYVAADFSGLPATDSDVSASDGAASDTGSSAASSDAGISAGDTGGAVCGIGD